MGNKATKASIDKVIEENNSKDAHSNKKAKVED
jgi:hypothetical protein